MARGYLEMMLPITLSLTPLERRNVLSSCSFVPTLLKTPGCRLLAKSISTPMVSKLLSRSSFSEGSLSSLPHFPLQGRNETDLRKTSAEYWIIQPLEPKRKLLPILQTFLDAIIREAKVFQMLCKITDSVSMQYYMNACVKEPMTILGSLNHNGPFQQKTPIPSTFLVLHSRSASLRLLDPQGQRALNRKRSRPASLLPQTALPFTVLLTSLSLFCPSGITSPPVSFPGFYILVSSYYMAFSLPSCLSTRQMSDLPLPTHSRFLCF